MSFRPDNSRSARAHQAEERARRLVQDVLDREERVQNNMASAEVDPWAMRFIVDESISEGAISSWREEATRARRIMRRWDIQSGYREKLREVEKRIDAMLHLAESLEESWDAAAAASRRLSEAEARDAAAFERERARQNDAAEQRRQREEKVRKLRRKAENIAADAIDAGREALEKLPPLSSPLKDLTGLFKGRGRDDDAPREVRRATARDLRKEPPLPED
ncbi:hypothetical protein [Corynebacterium lactis]|uniref:hypothetical protein n=1 Tax=Corynebacterium lactis TaxID=1231000 RepID=UPI0006A9CD3F|nr:hypothetical protein [Corynebacterium lactis]